MFNCSHSCTPFSDRLCDTSSTFVSCFLHKKFRRLPPFFPVPTRPRYALLDRGFHAFPFVVAPPYTNSSTSNLWPGCDVTARALLCSDCFNHLAKLLYYKSSVFLPILFSLSLSLSPPFAAVAHLGCCCCSSVSVRQNGGRPKFEAVNTRRIIKWAEKTRVSEIISFFNMNDFNDYPRILWRVIQQELFD